MHTIWHINDFAELKSNVLSPNFAHYGHIDIFFTVVRSTGYPFFSWNGRVYKVTDGQDGYEDTGKMIEEFE